MTDQELCLATDELAVLAAWCLVRIDPAKKAPHHVPYYEKMQVRWLNWACRDGIVFG